MKLGFIGTGVMGRGIINNLLKADYEVFVYNRTKAHAQSVIDNGAIWQDSPREIAESADVVMTMVGYPKDVAEQYYGEKGIFAGSHPGQIILDMTTSTPTLAKELTDAGREFNVKVLDAPVSGGDTGAKNGTLTIMVGGDEAAFNELKPMFAAISKAATLFGTAGRGQNAKMANQIMIAGTMLGMAESMAYAKESGLDLPQVLKTLGGGAAQNWSMDNYGPRVLSDDYEPGFYVKHYIKDLRIALDEAQKMQVDLPMTTMAEQFYTTLVDEQKLAEAGIHAIVNLWTQFA
jgi:3-hydroxyisobutyrate dehydrogenase